MYIDGKHEIAEDIINKLQETHLKAKEIKQSAMMIISTPETKTENVIFENITQAEIASSAKSSSGSGGPTQVDMEAWRKIVFLFVLFFWYCAARGLWSARTECGMVYHTGFPVCFM